MPKKILIDAGHYANFGKSPCKTSPTYYEGNMTWALCASLVAELKKYSFDVATTRADIKTDVPVLKRGQMAKGYDLFISLHSNSPGGKDDNKVNNDLDLPVIIVPLVHSIAFETFAGKIGEAIHTLLDTKYIYKKKGYKIYTKKNPNNPSLDYYGVIRGAVSVGCKNAMIIEHSFHTCEKTVAFLLKQSNLDKIAAKEAEIIADFFGVKKTEATTPKTEPAETTGFQKGDVVVVIGNYYYQSKQPIPKFVKENKWIVRSVKGDRVVIDESVDGKHHICSPVAAKDLKKV